MNDSALSVANYFIDKAREDSIDLKPLKLLKLVYLAHGYTLALRGYSVFDSRFDRVEAWRLGPVVPSVYHSFKHYKNNPITQKSDVFAFDGDKVVFRTPKLQDVGAISVCNFVWDRYKSLSDSFLVSLLHKDGTPWRLVYRENMNNIIPDNLTKSYYELMVKALNITASNGKKH